MSYDEVSPFHGAGKMIGVVRRILSVVLFSVVVLAVFHLIASQTEGKITFSSISSSSKKSFYQPLRSKQTIAASVVPSRKPKPPIEDTAESHPAHKPKMNQVTAQASSANVNTVEQRFVIKGQIENLQLKAVANSLYSDSLGEQVERKGSFTLFKTKEPKSSLLSFSRNSLPVVSSSNSFKSGIVTGNLSVKFKSWPSAPDDFASKHSLSSVSMVERIRTAFFSIEDGTNILRLMENLRKENNVQNVELEIFYSRIEPK